MAKLKSKPSPKNKKMKGNLKKKKAAKNAGSDIKAKKIADMSVDDMFSMVQDDDSDIDESPPPPSVKEKSKKKKKNVVVSKTPEEEEEPEDMEDDDGDFEEDLELENGSDLSSQDKYLEKLKKTDPEFYKTVMESSEVLDLKSSDEEESGDEDDDAKAEEAQSDEEGSDDSDVEFNDEQGRSGNITSEMIGKWEEELKGKNPINAFMEVQDALTAAIESLSGGKEDAPVMQSRYVVRGSQCFNAVVRLCLKNMAPALRAIFQIRDVNHLPSKSKRWKRYKNSVKPYLRQMISLTEVIAEPSAAEVVLRSGVLPLIPYYAGHPLLCKVLARRLIRMWATSEKKVRVLSFMALFRVTQILQGEFLEWILKKMYISYVQNCRFTSPTTWGLIDFMRLSLVEMYTLDNVLAYKHAFIYVRQMAIHLRNAILLPKKDRVQLVYNWQYIHCLNLWCDLLGRSRGGDLQTMIFPVTQVAIGAMKLQPTPTFFPLAFHICRMLTELSRNTGVFIPILPFLLEILNKSIFFKQPQKASIKPFDWMCVLRLSRSELKESAFKDGVVDEVYDGMVRYLSVVSSSIGFPDFVVPTVLQLKSFLKKCKSPNYAKRFKQLLDKITENTDFIENRRRDVKFGLTDSKAVKDWEISVRQSGTPLDKFYSNWRKIKEKEHQARITSTVAASEFDLPSVKKRELEKDGLEEFDSEEEEDDGDEDASGAGIRAKNDAAEEEDSANEDDEEESEGESEDEDEDEDSGPPKKKEKLETVSDIQTDFKVPHNGVSDIVREFNFSDDDNDDDELNDDYGVESDE